MLGCHVSAGERLDFPIYQIIQITHGNRRWEMNTVNATTDMSYCWLVFAASLLG